MCRGGRESIRRSRGGGPKRVCEQWDRVPDIGSSSRNAENKKPPARKVADWILTSRNALKSLFPRSECGGN